MTQQTAWARGYPVSESYPPSWHYFQSPAHLRAICALMGVAWEVGPHMPMSIAEIGCGTGYTAAVLAAGTPNAQVLGLDYNPAHIAEARSLASAAGLENLRYQEADLAELSDAELDRMPEFDLVTVHGVWSWVGDPVRDGVLRLLRRRLKPGGVALVTYNALPAAAGSLGLARAVRSALLSHGDSRDGLAAASRLVERLIAAEAQHLPPSGWRRLFTGEAPGARPGYVLHEFLTEHWRPSFFTDVASAMSTTRCEFVGSATIDENFPHMSLTPAQRELWDEAPDEAGRQLILDLCAPRAFRRDVYVRGLRRVPRDAAVDALVLTLAANEEGKLKLAAQAGVAELPQSLIDAVRGELEKGPQSIATLRALPGCNNATPSELLAFLIGSRCALPIWQHPGADANWHRSAERAQRFNNVAAERLAPFGAGAGAFGLATPALSGALPASALELAIAQQLTQDPPDILDASRSVTPVASDLIQRIIPAKSRPEPSVMHELMHSVSEVLAKNAPVWRYLGIV